MTWQWLWLCKLQDPPSRRWRGIPVLLNWPIIILHCIPWTKNDCHCQGLICQKWWQIYLLLKFPTKENKLIDVEWGSVTKRESYWIQFNPFLGMCPYLDPSGLCFYCSSSTASVSSTLFPTCSSPYRMVIVSLSWVAAVSLSRYIRVYVSKCHIRLMRTTDRGLSVGRPVIVPLSLCIYAGQPDDD